MCTNGTAWSLPKLIPMTNDLYNGCASQGRVHRYAMTQLCTLWVSNEVFLMARFHLDMTVVAQSLPPMSRPVFFWGARCGMAGFLDFLDEDLENLTSTMVNLW